MQDKGILFVVFGKEYESMAKKTITYSRRYTNLPFHILTDIKENSWEEISNTTFQIFDLNTPFANRQIKTTMIEYSPFERTIYMDCDAIIANKGIEHVFDLFNTSDILLVNYGTYSNGSTILSYYKITMRELKIQTPLPVYYGAFIGFNKNNNSEKFFNEWNSNWKQVNIEREMPALACTVKMNKDVIIKTIHESNNIFTWHVNPSAIVQHEYHAGWWNKYHPEVGLNR